MAVSEKFAVWCVRMKDSKCPQALTIAHAQLVQDSAMHLPYPCIVKLHYILAPGMSPQSPVPSMYACPAVGTPTYPPQTSQQQPSGSGGRSHQDEVRKDRSPIPKLNVKGGDAPPS